MVSRNVLLSLYRKSLFLILSTFCKLIFRISVLGKQLRWSISKFALYHILFIFKSIMYLLTPIWKSSRHFRMCCFHPVPISHCGGKKIWIMNTITLITRIKLDSSHSSVNYKRPWKALRRDRGSNQLTHHDEVWWSATNHPAHCDFGSRVAADPGGFAAVVVGDRCRA